MPDIWELVPLPQVHLYVTQASDDNSSSKYLVLLYIYRFISVFLLVRTISKLNSTSVPYVLGKEQYPVNPVPTPFLIFAAWVPAQLCPFSIVKYYTVWCTFSYSPSFPPSLSRLIPYTSRPLFSRGQARCISLPLPQARKGSWERPNSMRVTQFPILLPTYIYSLLFIGRFHGVFYALGHFFFVSSFGSF